MNFKIKEKLLNNNNINTNNLNNNKKQNKEIQNSITKDNSIIELFENLINYNLEYALKFFSNESNNKLGLKYIYYYKYYYIKSNNKKGKYSDKFKKIYNGKNYNEKKQLFRKKCKKFNIDDNNRLTKYDIFYIILSVRNNQTINKKYYI